jgi:hypothetical protein
MNSKCDGGLGREVSLFVPFVIRNLSPLQVRLRFDDPLAPRDRMFSLRVAALSLPGRTLVMGYVLSCVIGERWRVLSEPRQCLGVWGSHLPV